MNSDSNYEKQPDQNGLIDVIKSVCTASVFLKDFNMTGLDDVIVSSLKCYITCLLLLSRANVMNNCKKPFTGLLIILLCLFKSHLKSVKISTTHYFPELKLCKTCCSGNSVKVLKSKVPMTTCPAPT